MEEYQIRLIEEYRQLRSRLDKLHIIVKKYEAGTLEFTPNCSIGVLIRQEAAMEEYLDVLELRAEIEGIGIENLK